MLTYSEIETVLQLHPLKEQFFKYTADERAGAFAVAERDVHAALDNVTIRDEWREQFRAAVAEQALFLLLNPEYLAGEKNEVMGKRAAHLIQPLKIFSRIKLQRG